MIELSIEQIASEIGGKIIHGSNGMIGSVAKLEEAKKGSLGFFANPKYEDSLYSSKASAVIVPDNFTPKKDCTAALIGHPNPYFAFCSILAKYFNPNKIKTGVDPTAIVASNVKIGEGAYIGPYAVIEDNVVIGNNAQINSHVNISEGSILGNNVSLFSGVKIYSSTIIGNNCIIHSGSVIGSDGFGFAPVNGVYQKIPQVGNVVIENDVEIGANCCIDRATMGSTIIKEGTKLDNLVQIAHNVEVGSHSVIASQTGVAGSAKIGHHTVMGGQVGVAGHIEIAPFNSFGGQSGITGDIKKENGKYSGTPAVDINLYLRSIAGSRKIGDLIKEIQNLQKEINTLKKENE